MPGFAIVVHVMFNPIKSKLTVHSYDCTIGSAVHLLIHVLWVITLEIVHPITFLVAPLVISLNLISAVLWMITFWRERICLGYVLGLYPYRICTLNSNLMHLYWSQLLNLSATAKQILYTVLTGVEPCFESGWVQHASSSSYSEFTGIASAPHVECLSLTAQIVM